MTDDECETLAKLILSAAGQADSDPSVFPIVPEIDDQEFIHELELESKRTGIEMCIPIVGAYKRLRRIVAVRMMLNDPD